MHICMDVCKYVGAYHIYVYERTKLYIVHTVSCIRNLLIESYEGSINSAFKYSHLCIIEISTPSAPLTNLRRRRSRRPCPARRPLSLRATPARDSKEPTPYTVPPWVNRRYKKSRQVRSSLALKSPSSAEAATQKYIITPYYLLVRYMVQ